MKQALLKSFAAALLLSSTALAQPSPADPGFVNYGYLEIVSVPHFPIVGETAQISVAVTNKGGEDAENVKVRLSFNDWGVTFFGWQEIGETEIDIPAGETAIAQFQHVFENRAHTCLEALIVDRPESENRNDDRGQINLEVINTGETFDYWVPVVNNDDQPLNLLLLHDCKLLGDGRNFHCEKDGVEPIPREIMVPAGEVVQVPIHLDLRHAPPGAEIHFRLVAIDLAHLEHQNQVDIYIRPTKAKRLKNTALQTLSEPPFHLLGGQHRKHLDMAVRSLQKSLDANLWHSTDENRLKAAGGSSVFAHELAATNALLALLDSDLDSATKSIVNDVILDLVDADRILASTAGASEADLAPGDLDRREGDYRSAVNAYKQAWQAATP